MDSWFSWSSNNSDFHQTCLNELALSLTRISKENHEKETLLLSHCPPLHNPSIPLHKRGLNAIVSLGLFALRTKEGCSTTIVNYLVELLHRLPSSQWIHYTKFEDGLLTRDFYHKLTLILTRIAVDNPQYSFKITDALMNCLHILITNCLDITSYSKEDYCLVVVPSLMGLCTGLSGTHKDRQSTLATYFTDSSSDDVNTEVEKEELKWTLEQVTTLYKDIQSVFSTSAIQTADHYLTELPKSYLYPVISHAMKCALLATFKDILVNSKVEFSDDFQSDVLKLAENIVKEGTTVLRGGGVSSASIKMQHDGLLYIVKSMCSAVELLVWSAVKHEDGDAVFLHLSSLLAIHTGKLNVVVSPLRASILECLSKLACRFPDFINGALARLTEFLLSPLLQLMYCDAVSTGNVTGTISKQTQIFINESVPSTSHLHISRPDGFLIVLEALVKAVVRILKLDESYDSITSFIGSLGNKLYTTDVKEEPAVHTAECIIMLLSKLGVALSDKEGVVSRIVSVFQQRLFHPVSSLDGNIITELGNMTAELGDSETLTVLSQSMNEALGVAMTPYPTFSSNNLVKDSKHKRTDSKDISYSHIFLPVMDALVHVASHLKGKEQQLDFLQRVLQSFIQQGIEGKKASERKEVLYSLKASSSSFSLGLLLPVLATLCQRMEPFYPSPPSRVLKLFRDFWLYCILLGFSDSEKGVFPPGWYNNVRDIAAKSPLLIMSGAEKYLDKELELNHPLKKGDITLRELQEARLALQDALGRSVELDKLVSGLTFAQCMYVQSIYRLESVRLEKDSRCFSYIFQYLDDKGLKKELWVAMEAIAEKLFDKLLLVLDDKPSARERDEELESHAILLLFKFNHIRGRIKRLADNFLSKLVDKFPHLLWSKAVLHTMLDLLQQLSVHVHILDPEHCVVRDIKLSYLPHVVTLPGYMEKRNATIVNFAKRCGEIIELAINWAPDQTKSILENYVAQESHVLQGILHHSGVSLATSQLVNHFQNNKTSAHFPTSLLSSHPDCLKDTRSQSLSCLQLKSQFLGGIKMTTDIYGTEGFTSLLEQANAQLQTSIDKGDLDLITTALYSNTALLISDHTNRHKRSLLHSIVHLPVKLFREDVVTMATHCWQWLITARPELEFSFMREFSLAWQWTITERKGMFSSPSLKLHPQDVQPHVVLIEFLIRRFEVFHTRSISLVTLTSQLVHQSLTLGVGPHGIDRPQYISPSIAASIARFKFLTLAVQLLRGRLVASAMDRTLLREKVYNAALDYFCYQPLWIVSDLKATREAMTAMIDFWQAIKEIKNTVVTSLFAPATSSDVAPSTIPRNSSFWQALATDAPSSQVSWLNTLSSRSGSRSQSLIAPTTPTSRRSPSNVKSKVLLKRRNLILALLRHEVERLSAWQNPSGIPELVVPDEDSLQGWINPTQSERNWLNTMTMAFQASPHLAFNVYLRFKTIEAVTKELNRLIQTNPVAFIDIPEASQCLARKEVVERDSKELYHLLYWRGIPPAMALTYFTRPYSNHPITAQFANKAMRSFKPGEILLYIPQLVQALRYDKLGFAKDYIISATKSSQLLAHQFLWNIKANTYTDEEGEIKDPEIGTLLEELSEEILQGLSGAALKFYEREFSFFKKVTDISGRIRPFPKDERKEECLKALREITLEPGVYLPSNPESVVLEIDYSSGRPMQSAAKAPFLAKFKVQQCGINEMETLNTQDDNALSNSLEQFMKADSSIWQGSIFKVGDDVRQDMLALQIIKLFKDVYDDLGLPLYLVPYRVVATAAGCGVIEVVPDSTSRDQLGKQTQVSLNDYFKSIYGDDDTFPYQEARSNFICSMAAYSLISYLLQIKDRHNGNIMLDGRGHIIHIDFGFLFESSPGGNLGFEPDLKLTEEMLEIMAGKKSDSYRWFLDLCVQGYLAVRPYKEQVVAMVTLMLDTGFPCFRGNTIEELKARFRSHLSEKEAAKAIIEVVEASCLNFRTYSYDVIQDVQQKIYYHKN